MSNVAKVIQLHKEKPGSNISPGKENIMPTEGGPPAYFDKYLDARFASIDQKIDHIDKSIISNTEWMKTMMGSIQSQVSSHQATFDSINTRIDGLRWWIIGTAIVLFLGMGALIMGMDQLQNSWFQQFSAKQDQSFQKFSDLQQQNIQQMFQLHDATKHQPPIAPKQ